MWAVQAPLFDRNSFGTASDSEPYVDDPDRLANQPVDYGVYFISKEDADKFDWPPNIKGPEQLE